jgi:cell division protein FtsB
MKQNIDDLSSVEIAAILAEHNLFRLPDKDFEKLKEECIAIKKKHYRKSKFAGSDIASHIYEDFPHNTLTQDILLIRKYMSKEKKEENEAIHEADYIFHQKTKAKHYTQERIANDPHYGTRLKKQKNDWEKKERILNSILMIARNLLQKNKRTAEENAASTKKFNESLADNPEKSKKRQNQKNENAKKHRKKNKKRGKGLKGKRRR